MKERKPLAERLRKALLEAVKTPEEGGSKRSSTAPDQATWDEAMRIIDSFRGKLAVLPDEALSTDVLYD